MSEDPNTSPPEHQHNDLLRAFLEECNRLLPKFMFDETASGLDISSLEQTAGEQAGLWAGIRSTWDRRRLCWEFLRPLLKEHLQPWQTAWNDMEARNFQIAVRTLSDSPQPDSPDYFATSAELSFIFWEYEETLKFAEKGLAIQPDHTRCLLQKAAALHQLRRADEAHAILNPLYSEGMKKAVTQTAPGQMNLNMDVLFNPLNGSIRTPVMAFEFLSLFKEENQQAGILHALEDMFYYSPHFRLRHARYLLSKNEVLKSFAKYFALIEEMNWVQEAAINSLSIANELSSHEELRGMFDVQIQWLENLIREKGWPVDAHHNEKFSYNLSSDPSLN